MRHNAVDQVRRERNVLNRIPDDSIATLHFTFQDALSLYFGLEYCPGGELYEQIRARGRLDTDTARFYAAEIVLMLEVLRAHQIIHRDIKPENLLLTATGHLKLIDFGSVKDLAVDAGREIVSRGSIDLTSRGRGSGGSAIDPGIALEVEQDLGTASSDQNHESTTNPSSSSSSSSSPTRKRSPLASNKMPKRAVTLVGTADYVSPEVLRNDPVTYAADLWALGCVLYQMFAGRPPFKATTEYLTFQKIISGEYAALVPLENAVPQEAIDLIAALLQPIPEDRLGAQDLSELKSHAFFHGIDWQNLRELPAPSPVIVDTDSIGSAASSFDWELQSLVAALPKIGNSSPSGVIDLD